MVRHSSRSLANYFRCARRSDHRCFWTLCTELARNFREQLGGHWNWKEVASKEYYRRILKFPQKTLFHTQRYSLHCGCCTYSASSQDIREHGTKCSHQGICCSTFSQILAASMFVPSYNCGPVPRLAKWDGWGRFGYLRTFQVRNNGCVMSFIYIKSGADESSEYKYKYIYICSNNGRTVCHPCSKSLARDDEDNRICTNRTHKTFWK